MKARFPTFQYTVVGDIALRSVAALSLMFLAQAHEERTLTSLVPLYEFYRRYIYACDSPALYLLPSVHLCVGRWNLLRARVEPLSHPFLFIYVGKPAMSS